MTNNNNGNITSRRIKQTAAQLENIEFDGASSLSASAECADSTTDFGQRANKIGKDDDTSNTPPPPSNDDWEAAARRVDEEDVLRGRKPPKNDQQVPDKPLVSRYCSNRLRAQATRERIVGETTNQCIRLANAAKTSHLQRFYVTPPLNSYYRREVHRIADKFGLANESINGGAIRKADNYPFKRLEDEDFTLVYREVLSAEKSVLIVGMTTDTKDHALREEARLAASKKAPASRLKQFDVMDW